MKSWKTTLCGIIAAAAAGVAASSNLDPAIIKIAGIVSTVATAAIGFFARDNNVTSEAAGAVKK